MASHASPSSPPSPRAPSSQLPGSPQRSSRIPKRVPSLASGGPAVPSAPSGVARVLDNQQRHSSMPTLGSSRGPPPPPTAEAMTEQELRSPLPLRVQPRHEQQQPSHFAPTNHAHPPQIRFPSTSHSSPSAQFSSSRPHSQHPPAHSSSPRRCSMPRPKMERPSSTTYTSFPLPPPRTPGDEEDERRRGLSWGNRLLAPFTSTGGSSNLDLEAGRSKGSAERRGLLSPNDSMNGSPDGDGQTCIREREGLPKLSRSCLIAEIKCYGKYMLPPLIFFVAIALTVSLYAYGKAIEHESGGGTLAESP